MKKVFFIEGQIEGNDFGINKMLSEIKKACEKPNPKYIAGVTDNLDELPAWEAEFETIIDISYGKRKGYYKVTDTKGIPVLLITPEKKIKLKEVNNFGTEFSGLVYQIIE